MEAAERTGEELPERWSARAKTAGIVLRLLKGEEIGTSRGRCRCPCTSSSGGGGLLAGGTVQAAKHAGCGTRAQACAGEGRRADDEARDRGVVRRKKFITEFRGRG